MTLWALFFISLEETDVLVQEVQVSNRNLFITLIRSNVLIMSLMLWC